MEAALKIQEKGKELVSVNSPMEAMALALSQGADLDKLEKMLELQERWERMEAKKAYTQAMADFKANPPKINKDKHVNFSTAKGRTSYDHASLGNVTEKINKALAEHGLSAAWKTSQTDKISVTCTITHKLGYSEETTLSADAENSGTKNNIQAIGSTITYLQRYTLLSLTGLATHDQDNDGRSAEPIQNISEKQVSIIYDMLNSTESDEAKFLEWLKVESVETIPINLFNKAMSALKAKVKK